MPESDTFTPGSPPVPLSHCLDTVVMLTMGAHIAAAEMLVDAAGDAALDHTFSRLPAASKYVNQALWTHEDAAQNPALQNFLLSQVRAPRPRAAHAPGALTPPCRGSGTRRTGRTRPAS